MHAASPAKRTPRAPSPSGHVIFEREDRVFKLYAGKSMYALCVSEAGTLDHLYWGPALPPKVNLKYILRGNVPQPFDPTVNVREADPPAQPSEANAVLSEVMGQTVGGNKSLFDVWKEHRGSEPKAAQIHRNSSKEKELSAAASTFERRLENMTWRLLGMNKLGDESLETKATSMLLEEGIAAKMLRDDTPLARKMAASSSVESSGNLSDKVSEAGEPAPPRLDFLQHKEAPLRKRGPTFQSAPSNLTNERRSLPESKSERFSGGGVDMSALDLPISDDRLLAVSEAGTEMLPRRVVTHFGVDLPHLSDEAMGVNAAHVPPPLGSPVDHPVASTIERHGKNTTLAELSDMGTGDYRKPSFIVRYNSDGSTISPLTYQSHRIVAGKVSLPSPMPQVRPTPAAPSKSEPASIEPAATTLIITMVDRHTGLKVECHFTAMHNLEVIVRRLVVANSTASPAQKVSLLRAMSATVDFDVPLTQYWITHLCGSWARERHVVHEELRQGIKTFGSMRGTSSHQHAPFFAISEGHSPPEEESGNVFGFSLVYSGSFQAEAEIMDVGRLRVNLGVQSDGFSWNLQPGAEFVSPECVCVFSSEGLGGMSRNLHALVREHLIPPQWRHEPMPVLVNTWEAEYFGVSHDSVVAMARAARHCGVEMLVLDDGWFGERHDATSSLGDWNPNATKFPFGIRGLARDVQAEGMLFGLWIEPEMVSTNSKLYEEHPNWCLHLPGRAKAEGRNQLVLDLTRAEVRDLVFESIAATLRNSAVSYVKWDMNRHLTEAFSVVLPPDQQGEVIYRYTMGVYALHERFVTEFPHIRFEACSGGGGRFDLGILYFCPQVWCSDNTDALMRMKIQHGSSYIFPALTVGAHYSAVPNHITQGMTRKRTRTLVAMCGTFGYELDLRKVPPSDVAVIHSQIAAHKLVSPIVRDGQLYRLWDPFRVSFCAWCYVLKDRAGRATAAAAFAFNMSSTFWSNLVPRLCLRGLDPEALYTVTEPLPNNRTQKMGTLEVVRTPQPVYQLGAEKVKMYGASLMHMGIPVRFLTQDDSLLFVLNRCPDTPAVRE